MKFFLSIPNKLLFLLLLMLNLNLYAQKDPIKKANADSARKEKNYILMGKYFEDAVVLRWAPKNTNAWEKANTTGYQLYRFEYDKNNNPLLSHPVQLTSSAIKPLTLEQWKEQFKPEDTSAAIAAEVLYGKKYETDAKQGDRFSWEKAYTEHADMGNRFSIALFNAEIHPDIARGMGWRWEDKTAEKNKIYYYVLISPMLKEQPADTVSFLLSTKQVYKTPEMIPVMAVPWDSAITLYWSRAIASRLFSAYYIERSDDKGKTFHRVNRLPYTSSFNTDSKSDWMQFTDSIPQNDKEYVYRVSGITAFGETSIPSAPVTASGINKDAPSGPINVKAENTKGTQVRISWQKTNKEKDFAGFLIGRSNAVNGPYLPLDTVLLPATAQNYTDKYAVPWDKNFYIVAAMDMMGNVTRSMPAYAIMIDSVAPAQPLGLSGNIDSSGKVSLHWQWNKEPDLEGYNVYASNNAHDFYVVNNQHIADTSYVDSITLKTLTRHIYYRICAFDKTGNPSRYSTIIQLTKPDLIPPVAPVIDHFVVTDTSVVFSWAQSSSEDVAGQIVWRKEKTETGWIRLDSLDKNAAAYTDTKVERLKEYAYSLTAIDSSGLSSDYSIPLHARVYDNGKRKGVDDLKAAIQQDHTIKLDWTYNAADRQGISFMIYRSYNNNGLELYKKVSGDKDEFTDTILPGKGNYQYALKVVTNDGGASALIQSAVLYYEIK